jgi:CHAD domain-containing protein
VKPPAKKRITAGQAVKAALAASVKRLFDHESRVVKRHDPEALHQARVAVRRLRSDLGSFRSLIDREWSVTLRQELRWLGTELGAVRDLDVLIQRLRGDAARAGADAGGDPGVKALLAHLSADRASKRKELLGAMRSQRYERLRRRLLSAARAPRLTLASRLSALDGLVPIVRRRWKRLRRAQANLSAWPAVRALHRIRILAKHCRYAAEAVVIAVGEAAARFAAAAASLQDALGELNDAENACARLRGLRRNPTSAIASTALLAVEREAAMRARAGWPAAWRALAVKRLRSWF